MIELNLKGATPNNDDITSYDLKPFENAHFTILPPFLEKMKDMKMLEENFKNYLYDNTRIELFNNRQLKLLSKPGEELADFKSRMSDLIREERDKAVERLTEQYTKKLKDYLRLQEKLEKEEADVKANYSGALTLGSSVLGVLLGRTR